MDEELEKVQWQDSSWQIRQSFSIDFEYKLINYVSNNNYIKHQLSLSDSIASILYLKRLLRVESYYLAPNVNELFSSCVIDGHL